MSTIRNKVFKESSRCTNKELTILDKCWTFTTNYDKKTNTAAAGLLPIEIEESNPMTEEKTVWITNTYGGESGFNCDCYVRAMLSYSNYDIAKALTLNNLDTTNWVYNTSDGYYYYKKVLKEGQSTTPLFSGFSVNKDLVDTTYIGTNENLEINVYCEAYTADGFSSYKDAWKHALNPIGI